MCVIYMPVAIVNDKRGHEREREREGYKGGFERRKGKQEQYNYIIISKKPTEVIKITEIGA